MDIGSAKGKYFVDILSTVSDFDLLENLLWTFTFFPGVHRKILAQIAQDS